MPLTPILIIEIFDCWDLDFMRPFPPSCGVPLHFFSSLLCVKVGGGHSNKK